MLDEGAWPRLDLLLSGYLDVDGDLLVAGPPHDLSLALVQPQLGVRLVQLFALRGCLLHALDGLQHLVLTLLAGSGDKLCGCLALLLEVFGVFGVLIVLSAVVGEHVGLYGSMLQGR